MDKFAATPGHALSGASAAPRMIQGGIFGTRWSVTLEERQGEPQAPSSTGADQRTSVSVAELTCGDVRSQLNDHLDGELDPTVRERVDRHLAQCKDCRAFQQGLDATVRGLQSMPARNAPTDVRERLRQRLSQLQPE